MEKKEEMDYSRENGTGKMSNGKPLHVLSFWGQMSTFAGISFVFLTLRQKNHPLLKSVIHINFRNGLHIRKVEYAIICMIVYIYNNIN